MKKKEVKLKPKKITYYYFFKLTTTKIEIEI